MPDARSPVTAGALRADLIAIVRVAGQRQPTERQWAGREADATPRRHGAIGLQLTTVGVRIGDRAQVPGHPSHPPRASNSTVAPSSFRVSVQQPSVCGTKLSVPVSLRTTRLVSPRAPVRSTGRGDYLPFVPVRQAGL